MTQIQVQIICSSVFAWIASVHTYLHYTVLSAEEVVRGAFFLFSEVRFYEFPVHNVTRRLLEFHLGKLKFSNQSQSLIQFN